MTTKGVEATRPVVGAGEESRKGKASEGVFEVRFAPKGFPGFISVLAGASLGLLALMRFLEADPTPLKYALAVIGGLNFIEGLFLLQRWRLSYVRVRDGSVHVRRWLPLTYIYRTDVRFARDEVVKVVEGEGKLYLQMAGGGSVRLDRRLVSEADWKRLWEFFNG